MNKAEHKQIIKQICDFMGEDIDSPACQEVADHLNTCPTCRVQFDTVKKTVTLCREMDDEKKLPDDVKNRLYKVLDLEQIKSRNDDKHS
jgi:predicted anti-sigma-YlaC factor YlaD